jgi:folate-dependent phosphoribosylglycinamide formyltransferase PurN
MTDNRMTPALLAELQNLGLSPDVLFLLKPTTRVQIQRLLRKLRGAGLGPTIQRITQALLCKWVATPPAAQNHCSSTDVKQEIHLVSDFNSESCRKLVRKADLDILILMTDTIIRRSTFSIPRIGCLNAHPGWLPAYRGLGSTLAMLRDGRAPAITIHFIDEGIDTGPVIIRRILDPRAVGASSEAELRWARAAAALIIEAFRKIENCKNRIEVLDTFIEPSNMTRGFPARKARVLLSLISKSIGRLQPVESCLSPTLLPSGAQVPGKERKYF